MLGEDDNSCTDACSAVGYTCQSSAWSSSGDAPAASTPALFATNVESTAGRGTGAGSGYSGVCGIIPEASDSILRPYREWKGSAFWYCGFADTAYNTPTCGNSNSGKERFCPCDGTWWLGDEGDDCDDVYGAAGLVCDECAAARTRAAAPPPLAPLLFNLIAPRPRQVAILVRERDRVRRDRASRRHRLQRRHGRSFRLDGGAGNQQRELVHLQR